MKITVKVDSPFTQVSNILIKDSNVSLKAKGLYTHIASKPGVWDFSAKRIALECKDGADSVMSGLKELEDTGYLSRFKNTDGTVDYTLRWSPWSENPEEPERDIPIQGNSLTGIAPTISNTDSIVILKEESNTDIQPVSKSIQEENKSQIIQGILNEFVKVNPAMQGMRGWKVHRDACWSLFEIFGLEAVAKTIRRLPELPNLVDNPKYAPYGLSPAKLLENWTKIQSVLDSNQPTHYKL